MRLELTCRKINISLAVIFVRMIGVPPRHQGLTPRTSANLGLALLLVLGYYMLTVMVKWLDRHPEYRPDLLLWAAELIFLGWASGYFCNREKVSRRPKVCTTPLLRSLIFSFSSGNRPSNQGPDERDDKSDQSLPYAPARRRTPSDRQSPPSLDR